MKYLKLLVINMFYLTFYFVNDFENEKNTILLKIFSEDFSYKNYL
jgi:hypothetical protein